MQIFRRVVDRADDDLHTARLVSLTPRLIRGAHATWSGALASLQLALGVGFGHDRSRMTTSADEVNAEPLKGVDVYGLLYDVPHNPQADNDHDCR